MSDPWPTTNSVLFSPSMLCQIGQLVGTYASLHYDKEACRTSPLSGKEYIVELLTSNEGRIHEVLRMPKTTLLDPRNWLASAKRWPVSDTVVLRPDSPRLDPASCASCTSCTHMPYLVASGTSGDPCLHWFPSGHIQPSNTASHAS